MTVPSVHCEAKLHGLRKTQDGVVVSFSLHPQEVPDGLMLAGLGTRYMLALAQIGDDEKPVEAKPKQPWNEMELPKRAALLCKDTQFQDWVSHGKQPGASLAGPSEDGAIRYLRMFCGVNTRSDIQPGSIAAKKYERLETGYFAAIGRIAPPR